MWAHATALRAAQGALATLARCRALARHVGQASAAVAREAKAREDLPVLLRAARADMAAFRAAFFPSEREYSRRYGLDERRAAMLPEHAIVLHPGPMNRGMEITAGVADGPRSVIVEQVTNGVSIRMAVLYLLLGGQI